MPLSVRVLQFDFPIRREYTAGHVLSEAEATAMNQLLVANVRNNVHTWVAKEARGTASLTAEQHEYLTEKISDYADRYEFKVRKRSGTVSPYTLALREVAFRKAEAWGNQNGYSSGGKEVEAKFLEYMNDFTVQDEAARLVQSRHAVAKEALVGIL